jgi:hypothetical protein
MLFLRYYLWIAPNVVLALCLIRLLHRGLHRRVPIFVTYVAFEVINFLILLTINLLSPHSSSSALNAYRWALNVGLCASTVLELGVLYELANELLLSRSTLAEDLRPALRWTAALLLLLTAIASGRLSLTSVQHVVNVFQVLDFSSSTLQVGLLVVLLLFSRVLRVSWRSFPVGIAVGFGILGCIELAAAALLSVLGDRGYIAIDVLRLAAFQVSVLIWLLYLIFPEREPKFTGKGFQKSELELWDQELQRMVQP